MHAMDPGAHHNPSQSTLTPVSSSRRRSRENETPQQRQKREKAAERQRRKRERDRTVNNINAIMAFTQPTDAQALPQPQPSQPPTPTFTGQEMTPEELSRRERVRAAARERQRKHRSLVKQRKMRELGLDMPNDMMQGMEEYRVNGDGQYQQVLPHEMPHQPHAMNPQDASFPQAPPPQLTGGQNFASTLLLSFSCAPLLKQHLLRTLAITSEELASLEPIIAEAFDHWDHQVRAAVSHSCRNNSLYISVACTMPNKLQLKLQTALCLVHPLPHFQMLIWPTLLAVGSGNLLSPTPASFVLDSIAL